MKRILPIFILTVLLFTATASAGIQAAYVNPTLGFNGTTASCKLTVTDQGKHIDATLELWRGSTFVTSWNETGTSSVRISETYDCITGVSYYD